MGPEEMKQLALSGTFLMSMTDMWAADGINRTNQIVFRMGKGSSG